MPLELKMASQGGLTIKKYFKVLSKTTMTTRAVTNPKKSDPDPNPNEMSCRFSDPDPIIN